MQLKVIYSLTKQYHAEYKGNRWDYETSVNEIGWRLTHLNSVLIQKRGLLQRAVDRFAYRVPGDYC